ncbi:hypothetical protein RB594_003396 [Gaeumannomyces avenae]
MDFKALQLQTIELRSRPFGKRAIAWSSDAELAVAADDSVSVFVPHFPRPDPDPQPASEGGGGEGNDDTTAANGVSNGARFNSQGAVPLKPQYSDGQRRIPIALPRVNPRVNRHLFHAAGLECPYDPYDSDLSEGEGEGGGGGGAAAPEVEDGERQDGDDDDNDDVDMSDGNRGGGTARDMKRQKRDRERQQQQEQLLKQQQQQYRRQISDTRDPNNPFRVAGAGSPGGNFTSVGATLNHVVSLAWSPPIGRNGRCLLAVHSAAGYVAVYGEPLVVAGRQEQQQQPRLGDRYDAEGWEVLWGVGERLAVPPQRAWGEAFRSFAWSRELWPGRALLALQTDAYEVVVLAVRTRAPPTGEKEGDMDGGGDDWARGDLTAGWRVEEVARFDARGPHPAGGVRDLDYVPYKTGLGLAFGPCLTTPATAAGGEAKECLLGFLARNYVGFRKITIKKEWSNGQGFVQAAEADVHGECLFMSTDAFLTFEDAIWNIDGHKVCRAIVATPFTPKIFKVKMSATAVPIESHPLKQCNTTYPAPEERSNNPIQDLVIHPPSLLKTTDAPLYTLVRMSASHGSTDWYQTNAALADYSSNERNPRPRWAVDISRRLEISMPKEMLARTGVKALGIVGDDDDDEGDGGNDDLDDDDDLDDADVDEDEDDEWDSNREAAQNQHSDKMDLDGDDDSDSGDSDDSGSSKEPGRPSNGESQTNSGPPLRRQSGADETSTPDDTAAQATAKQARKPGALRQVETSDNVHIWRARLFGVALSPGGGCSAAVWAKTAAAVAERGAWHQARSTVSFDFRPGGGGGGGGIEEQEEDPRLARLSTEARAFECLYGRGPAVPGVTAPADVDEEGGGGSVAEMRGLLQDKVAGAECPYCKGALERTGRYFACPGKHFFDSCILTGYPVLEHGASRVCGVCGVRRLKTDAIVPILAEREARIRELGFQASRCVRCGGKYID